MIGVLLASHEIPTKRGGVKAVFGKTAHQEGHEFGSKHSLEELLRLDLPMPVRQMLIEPRFWWLGVGEALFFVFFLLVGATYLESP